MADKGHYRATIDLAWPALRINQRVELNSVMTKEISPGIWIDDADYERLVAAGTSIDRSLCADMMSLTDSQYVDHLMRSGVGRVGMLVGCLDEETIKAIENSQYGVIGE